MRTKFTNLLVLCLFSFVLVGATANAATIEINNITGIWENDVPDSAVTGEGTSEIRWGNPVYYDKKSGYDFDAESTPFSVDCDQAFELGEFTHHNYPITGTALDTVDLKTTVDLTIDGVAVSGLNFTYNFDHTETPNSSDPIASRDIVVIENNSMMSDVFTINDVEYTIYLSGFLIGGELVDTFYTWEKCKNTAKLFAMITTPGCVIPEPSTYLLLGSMLICAVALKRRKIRKAA